MAASEIPDCDFVLSGILDILASKMSSENESARMFH